eukprot:TRINITY_DN65398_c0_g1_i1.p1 TRINITY_DN65398_c0_g1~~TRINITY_DN65398_c0_g1_i1.p1  ORF type:complete len:202 (-),score=35.34 TRINITY_DN65398_c0_g1_i1:28-633(-)
MAVPNLQCWTDLEESDPEAEQDTPLILGQAASPCARMHARLPGLAAFLVLGVLSFAFIILALSHSSNGTLLLWHSAAEVQLQTKSGQCSSDDMDVLLGVEAGDTGPFFTKLRECSLTATGSALFFGLKEGAFEQCFMETKLSQECSSCYGASAKYMYDNCKVPCLINWCGKSCIDCGLPFEATLATCVGTSTEKLPHMQAC